MTRRFKKKAEILFCFKQFHHNSAIIQAKTFKRLQLATVLYGQKFARFFVIKSEITFSSGANTLIT